MATRSGVEEFKSGLSSIDISDIKTGRKMYVHYAKGIGDKLAPLASDTFGTGAKLRSITEAIQKLQDIEQKIENTNYYYTQDDETKKQLMARIQENMAKLKSIKTQLETQAIEDDAEKFNENIYKAKMKDFKEKMTEAANTYNGSSNRYVLESYPTDATCRVMYPYAITENGPVRKDGCYYPDGQNVYDVITLAGKAAQMLKELQKRNIWTNTKVPKRPEDTKTNRYMGDIEE